MEEEPTAPLAELSAKLSSLQERDADQFNQLKVILRLIAQSGIDSRKFETLRNGVIKFLETKNRKMSLEEMVDYCRTLFADRKFCDMLTKFCAEAGEKEDPQHENEQNDLEKSYTTYISLEKLSFVKEVLENLPLVV